MIKINGYYFITDSALSKNGNISDVKDAVSSRHILDRDTVFERLQAAEIHVTTTETVLFELLKSAEDPLFKQVQALIK